YTSTSLRFPYTTLFRSFAVGNPLLRRHRIDRADLPLLQRVGGAFAQAFDLLLLVDVEVILQHADAGIHQHLLERHDTAHEVLVLDRKSTRLNSSHVKIS